MTDVSLYICEELGISIEELINGERDKSDVAMEKAIISVIKSKDKMRRKLKYVIIFFIILIFVLIFFFYKNKEDELFEDKLSILKQEIYKTSIMLKRKCR